MRNQIINLINEDTETLIKDAGVTNKLEFEDEKGKKHERPAERISTK